MASINRIAIIWTVAIVIVAVGITAASDVPEPVKTQTENTIPKDLKPLSIFLQTDREKYTINDRIIISGSVEKIIPDLPVTLLVINPKGDLVAVAQLDIGDEKRFSEAVPIGGPLWEHEGMYTIKAQYGDNNSVSTTINFVASYSKNAGGNTAIHPCQRIVEDQYNLYKQDKEKRFTLPREDITSWNNFVSERMGKLSNELAENCQENIGDWLTEEYKAKMELIKSAGF